MPFVTNWDISEVFFLKNNYLNFSVQELADSLDKTYSSVSSKMGKLGIKTRDSKHLVTHTEETFISDNYITLGAKECARLLGLKTSTVASYATLRGLNNCFKWKKWTKKDEKFLSKFYPIAGAAYCSKKLDRPVTAINRRASSLGIKYEFSRKDYVNADGYILTWEAASYKYVLKHRQVMQEKLGRKLNTSELVHHVDEDKSNNEPNNLKLTTRAKHLVHHLHTDSVRSKTAITKKKKKLLCMI